MPQLFVSSASRNEDERDSSHIWPVIAVQKDSPSKPGPKKTIHQAVFPFELFPAQAVSLPSGGVGTPRWAPGSERRGAQHSALCRLTRSSFAFSSGHAMETWRSCLGRDMRSAAA